MNLTTEIRTALRLRGISTTCGNCHRWGKGLCSVGDFFKRTRIRNREESCEKFYPRELIRTGKMSGHRTFSRTDHGP